MKDFSDMTDISKIKIPYKDIHKAHSSRVWFELVVRQAGQIEELEKRLERAIRAIKKVQRKFPALHIDDIDKVLKVMRSSSVVQSIAQNHEMAGKKGIKNE